MRHSEKKAREESWLNRLKEITGLEFEIEDTRDERERPDFLIRYQGRIVGVEIAEVQLDRNDGLNKGSSLQRELSLQQSVVSRAQELYFAVNSQPINVKVCFSSRKSLQAFNRNAVAQAIADGLRDIVLAPFERCRLDRFSDRPIPAPVSSVHVLGLPDGITPRWQVVSVGWTNTFCSSDVAPLLKKKNSLIHQYQENVSENWLLIVADGRNPAGMFEPPCKDYADLPASKFDRTFMLCDPDRFFFEWPYE
jgi:hypothetical protein